MSIEEARRTASEYRCAECGGRLVLYPEGDGWIARCVDPNHRGLAYEPTPMELVRSGEARPAHLTMQAERKAPVIRSVKAMASICREMFGLSERGARLVALFALQTGLDPRFGEVACVEYRSKDSPVPVVMITTRGWRTLAARECPDYFERPPVLYDLDPNEKEAHGFPRDAWVSMAVGRIRGDPEGVERRAYGVVTRAEWEALPPRAPWKNSPQNQARRRAERHWYEENLPMAVERAREAMAEALSQLHEEARAVEADFIELESKPKQTRMLE